MLTIHLITLGKLKEPYWQDAEREYVKRLTPYAKVIIHEAREESFGDRDAIDGIKKKEAEKIKSILLKIRDAFIFILDETGEKYSSMEFAEEIKKSFQNINLMEEKANIRIENGTATSGLGSKFARIVTNMGAIVITVDNSEQPTEQTEIILNSKRWENSVTLQELKSALNNTKISTKVTDHSTADIVVVVGSNYAQITQGSSQNPPVESK
jgi:hypothetical protein